jgi:hypothetical protein
MSFMNPVVQKGEWWKVETNNGTDFIPLDIAPTVKDLKPFLGGQKILSKEKIMGYGARLSASGYMDCTEWCVFDSEKAAWSYLLENHADAFTWAWQPGSGYHLYLPNEEVATIVKEFFQSINGNNIEQDVSFLYTVDESEEPTDEVDYQEI